MRQKPGCQPVAADFTLKMMQVGKQRYPTPHLNWCGADAMMLPFPDESFEAVVSGFLLRNVIDISSALREQFRVLRPGGRIVALDTTRPEKTRLSPLVDFHLHVIIPNLGQLVTGVRDAYNYLPDSTEAFLNARELADALTSAGFREVGFQRWMLGTIAIHWGVKGG
jgi:demethylmenaquinone methyltransferase/2-methoxy-6-polyprenyl-1,4-benzoquinol methylase